MRQGRRRKHAYFRYGYSPLVMSDLFLPGSYIRKHRMWNNIRSHVVGRYIKSYMVWLVWPGPLSAFASCVFLVSRLNCGLAVALVNCGCAKE